MNEKKLNEIISKAGLNCPVDGVPKSWNHGDYVVSSADLKNLIQLVVNEASDACLKEAEKWRGEQDITDFKLCAQVVKEHFGVQ